MKKLLVMSLILSLAFGSSAVFAATPPEIYQSLTGKTIEQLKEMREEGKTLWEAAEEDGVLEEFKDKIYEDAKEKLDAAVEDGKLTQEEADEKLAYLEEKLESGEFDRGGYGPKKELTDEDKEDILAKAKEKLDSDVEEGKITQEDADERLAKLEEDLENGNFGKGGHGPRKELTEEEKEDILDNAKERLNNAVEEGKMTQEEVDERLADLEEKLENGDFGKGGPAPAKELTEEDIEEHLAKAEERLNAKVEEGKMTQDEADEKLAELKEMLESGDFNGGFHGPKDGARTDGEGFKGGERPEKKGMNFDSPAL